MQESLFRERNRRYAEVLLMASVVERIGHILINLVPAASQEESDARHKPLRDTVNSMISIYEAELYEERYMPAYQQAQAEKARRAKLAAIQREHIEAAVLKRAASFSDEERAKTKGA